MPRPKTKALEEALEKLQAARDDFAQAFDGILSQLDLSSVEQALADWRQATEAFAHAARAVHQDASDYFDEHSEKWQDQTKGRPAPHGWASLSYLRSSTLSLLRKSGLQ